MKIKKSLLLSSIVLSSVIAGAQATSNVQKIRSGNDNETARGAVVLKPTSISTANVKLRDMGQISKEHTALADIITIQGKFYDSNVEKLIMSYKKKFEMEMLVAASLEREIEDLIRAVNENETHIASGRIDYATYRHRQEKLQDSIVEIKENHRMMLALNGITGTETTADLTDCIKAHKPSRGAKILASFRKAKDVIKAKLSCWRNKGSLFLKRITKTK